MIQTRTRSLSDKSVDPTQPLLLSFSRSNSAAMAGGHADLSARSVVLSSMVRAMVFLQGLWGQYRKPLRLGKAWQSLGFRRGCGRGCGNVREAPRAGRRRLDERAVGR